MVKELYIKLLWNIIRSWLLVIKLYRKRSQNLRHVSMISGHSISTGFRGLKGCQQDPRDRGVTSVVASTMQISSAKDKNPIFGELYFYGVIF